jgi:cytochrome b561
MADSNLGSEAKFQGSFAMLHIYAAGLATVAVVMHLAAAWYHARRWRRVRHDVPGVVAVLPFTPRRLWKRAA